MKVIYKIWSLVLVTLVVVACEKLEDLPYYASGKQPELSSSVTSLKPLPADSNNTVLTLNWTDPEYASSSPVKFLVQIDSAGRSFSKAVTREVSGALTTSFLAKELNNILLGFGFEFNKEYDVQIRVISSYANNNDQMQSNTITVKMTPYLIPPKVEPPSSGKLYIVGDATAGGWNNPVPTPSQELTKIDSVTYGGIFNLTGGKQYLILPVNGDWGFKYSVASNLLPGLAEGGDFGANLSDNFPGPAADGWYKIILNFQSGKFTVTPFNQQHGLPDNLYIVGDATPGDWSNPVPVPSQQFTRKNSTQFELTLDLINGKKYLFLPENGNWGMKFGAVDGNAPGIKLGGEFKPEGSDMPSPDDAGTYKIVVDFINNSYKLTKL